MAKGKWIVYIKRDEPECWEISVIREGNEHGFKSYGWFDEDKIYISGSGGPCRETCNDFVWDGLVELARKVANHLNRQI